MTAQEKQAEARKANKNKGKNNEARSNNAKASQSNAPAPKRSQRSNLIEMIVPDSVAAGEPVTVKIKHTLPSSANEQTLTLTMKGGTNGVRIERKTVIATGDGVTEVTFDVPAEVPGGIVSFAAFVGEDFQSSLQHLQSDPVPAK